MKGKIKMVCIDNSEKIDYNKRVRHNPEGLKEEEVYICSEKYIDTDGDLVVYVHELDFSFLAIRFRKIDYEFVEEVIARLKEESILA